MKTNHKTIATGVLLFALAGSGVAHADIVVNLNGQPLATSVSPMQIGGHTLVPMRDLFEALGAQLDWNPVAQTITAQKDLTKIQLAIDNPNALVNGRTVPLEQPATLINGRTFVPLRFVAEATGAKVDWNGALQLISIRSDMPIAPGQPLPVDTYPAPVPNPGLPVDNVTQPQPPLPVQPLPNGGYQPANPTWPAQPQQPIQNFPVDPGQPRPFPRDPGQQQVDDVRTISVPEGAVIPVQIDRPLSSATARVGQQFTASVISRRLGDSEFPAGTKILGRVIEAVPSDNNQPGVLDFEWNGAVLPDGTQVPFRGELTSLDSSNVNLTGGHIVANGAQSTNKLKVIGVGAAGGFVLGRVLKTNSTVTTILGAAGGYLFGKARDKKAQEATIANGTTLGVRVRNDVHYDDVADYYGYRSKYLRDANRADANYDPNYYGFDETNAVPRNRRNMDNRTRYEGYDYSDNATDPNPDTAPLNVGDIYPEDVRGNNGNRDNRDNRDNRPPVVLPPVNDNRNGDNRNGGNRNLDNRIIDNRGTAALSQISIPAGVVVPVTLDADLSSATAHANDMFTATVISKNLGDSEFPAGTKLQGRVIEAHPQQGDQPGTLDLQFRKAVLPDGSRISLNGRLISLDDKSLETKGGRVIAKGGSSKDDRLKVIGIGAAAGFVVGRIVRKDGILPSLLGALGGYLYGQKKDDKPAEARLPQGTKLGVKLDDDVSFADTTNYGGYRTKYMRNS